MSQNLNVAGSSTFSGVMYIGGAGAYIQAYTIAPYVQINQLTVTPGVTALAGVTVNAPAFFNSYCQMNYDQGFQWNDANAKIFRSSNQWFYFDSWQGWIWRSASNGFPAALTCDYAGNMTVVGAFQANSSGNFNAGLTCGGNFTAPYIISNGNADIGGGVIFFRHNGSYYIEWDGGAWFQAVNMNVMSWGMYAFNANPGIFWQWNGGQLVASHSVMTNGANYYYVANGGIWSGWNGGGPGYIQFSHNVLTNGTGFFFQGNGGIYLVWNGSQIQSSHSFYSPGASFGGDVTCSATFYVKWGGTTTFQVAAGNGETFCNADCHFANGRFYYQVAAYNSYNGAPGGGNQNAFLAPNNGDYSGQGLANQWRTWSSERFKLNVEPLQDALSLVRGEALRGVRYDNIDVAGDNRGGPHRPTGTTTRQVGFIADQWLPYFPEIVGVDREGKAESMDYSRVGAVMWEAFRQYVRETDEALADLRKQLAARAA
jgi:hypothetical protein